MTYDWETYPSIILSLKFPQHSLSKILLCECFCVCFLHANRWPASSLVNSVNALQRFKACERRVEGWRAGQTWWSDDTWFPLSASCTITAQNRNLNSRLMVIITEMYLNVFLSVDLSVSLSVCQTVAGCTTGFKRVAIFQNDTYL